MFDVIFKDRCDTLKKALWRFVEGEVFFSIERMAMSCANHYSTKLQPAAKDSTKDGPI